MSKRVETVDLDAEVQQEILRAEYTCLLSSLAWMIGRMEGLDETVPAFVMETFNRQFKPRVLIAPESAR